MVMLFIIRSLDHVQALVVGLGGGSLPMYLHQFFDYIYVETAELDPGNLTNM